MEKQILKWLETGLITKEKALELLNDCKIEAEKTRKIRSQIALYTVGTILIGLGVISFVAANDWLLELLNRADLLKILALSGATLGCLYYGYKLAYEQQKFPRLGKTLIVLSSILIGGTYALIGQIYNFNADNSSLMFLWLASILPMAYIFKDKTINILSVILFILGIVFYYMELSIHSSFISIVFLPTIIGIFLYCLGNVSYIKKNFNSFSLSYKVFGLISIFLSLLITSCYCDYSIDNKEMIYATVPMIWATIFAFGNIYFEKEKDLLFKLEQGFIFAVLAFLTVYASLAASSQPLFYYSNHIALTDIIWLKIAANIILIFMISTGFTFGYKFENVKLINLSTTFLVIYLITRYFQWGWEYMDKSIFFLGGGTVLILLGYFLEKKKRELIKGDK